MNKNKNPNPPKSGSNIDKSMNVNLNINQKDYPNWVKQQTTTVSEGTNETINPSLTDGVVKNYQEGWVCPKCGAVMAPWKDCCVNCSKNYPNIVFGNGSGNGGYWNYMGQSYSTDKTPCIGDNYAGEVIGGCCVKLDENGYPIGNISVTSEVTNSEKTSNLKMENVNMFDGDKEPYNVFGNKDIPAAKIIE